jgi:holo-[acyl-carrier protein] synthase
VLCTGVDLVAIPRFHAVLDRHGDRFRARIYTPLELQLCRDRVPELAARFAAKEAVSKALGVGIFAPGGIGWRDVEVLSDRRGRPLLYLYGPAQARANALGLTEWAISLSHERDVAIAFVVAGGPGPAEPADPVAWRKELARYLAKKMQAEE